MKKIPNKLLEDANVIKMYVEDNMSIRQISLSLGISDEVVRKYLCSKGIPRRAPKRRECLREKPPVGQRFGNWTVISEELKSGKVINGSNNRNLFWNVQCDCGYIGWKDPAHLKNGTSTRCKKCGNVGLYRNGNSRSISGLIRSKLNQIKENLKTRKKVQNLEFTLTEEDIQELYDNSHACALSGLDITLDYTKRLQQQMLSIDRIDSNKGYTKDNIQLVDKRINMMKGTLTNDEFIELCCKVAEKHGWSRCLILKSNKYKYEN